MNFIKQVKTMLKNTNKSKKKYEQTNTKDNSLYFDLGNSNIKAMDNSDNKIIFRSCVRAVTLDEVGLAKNSVNVDGTFYLIGEPKTPLNTLVRKVDRKDIKQLISYAIKRLGLSKDSDVNIFMLLPQNQLCDFNLIKQRLNGSVIIDGDMYKLNLIRAFAEGETPIIDSDNHKLIIDIGGGTTDIFEYDRNNNKIEQITINMGMRDIEPYYCSLGFQSVENVNKNIQGGYVFSKEELSLKKKIDIEQVGKIMRTASPVLKNIVRGKTDVYIIGGGAMALSDSIRDCINLVISSEWYHIRKVETPLYANIEGLKQTLYESGEA